MDQRRRAKAGNPANDPLEKARLTNAAERKLHTKELTDAFTTTIRNFKGTTADAAKRTQVLTDEKNQFVVNGYIPFSRPMRDASTANG